MDNVSNIWFVNVYPRHSQGRISILGTPVSEFYILISDICKNVSANTKKAKFSINIQLEAGYFD